MAPQVRPKMLAAAPLVARAGELLDVAAITEGIDFLDYRGLFESYSCMTTDAIPTMPCPATFLAAPVQAASATATSGGTLAAGTYRAKITAVNERGETIASNEVSQVTTGAASTITWNWAAVTGATGYRVYVTAVGGAVNSERFLVQVGTVLTYVWTGTPAYDGAAPTPPTGNTANTNVVKTFESPAWPDGFTFAVYGGAVCKGFDAANVEEVERVFRMNESVGVERALMLQRLQVNGTSWAAATDLTPAGGAVTPQQGLALLEGHASWNYAGVPTIHAPRSIGSLLSQNNQIKMNGRAFYTAQGSKFASGGGYESPNTGPAGTTPAAGEKWMFTTGEVVLARSGLISQTELNRDTDDKYTLVERQYVAGVDCYTAAVRVKIY